jgi:hypothetical protein
MMILGDKKYKQKKGNGVYFQISNPRYETEAFKFDQFKFYSPEGDKDDGDGFTYFQVQADEVPILRDAMYDKEIFVIIEQVNVNYYPVFLHPEAVGLTKSIGLDGELMAKINVPVVGDIIIEYFESEV